MRAFHHHHKGSHDPATEHLVQQHRAGRATPWFVLAAVAFLAAMRVG